MSLSDRITNGMINHEADTPAKNIGFTIVELLIVIVVIGILAVITVVSYNGITQVAAQATLKSDLANSKTILELGKVKSGGYLLDDSSLKFSPGVVPEYTSDSTSYCLTLSSDAAKTSYFLDSSTGSIQEGACPGHVGYVGPVEPVGTTFLATGYNSACAVNEAKLFCWGRNYYGQLGNNDNSDSSVPVVVSTSGELAGRDVTAVSVGESHTCAVADGKAFCWGWNNSGQLGNNTTSSSSVPVAVSVGGVLAGKTVTAVAAGQSHTCAIADGKAYCWGSGNYGQLGNNTTSSSSVPVAVSVGGVLAGKTVTAISAGHNFTCAVADGKAYCWGRGSLNQLGNNNNSNSSVPVSVYTGGVLSGLSVTAISSGYYHNCAIADGSAYCWGGGSYGQLGNNSSSDSPVPVAVSMSGVLSGQTLTSISSGDYSSCVVASSKAYCWGRGNYGQLGSGGNSDSSVPAAVLSSGVLSGKNVTSVAEGGNFGCSIASGHVFCWGSGGTGELGNGIKNDSLVPVAVSAYP